MYIAVSWLMSILKQVDMDMANTFFLAVLKRTGPLFLLFAMCSLCPLLLAGCTVGPDFVRPQAPEVTRYTHGMEPTETVSADGQKQYFEYGSKIAEDWWRLFNSPKLEAIIKSAIAENQNFQAAQAHLRQSQEELHAGYGAFFPQAGMGFDASRQKFSTAKFGSSSRSSIFNLYTASVNVSYVLDVFGGQRRTVESLAAQVDYQNYTAQATYLTLLGNVINTGIAEAAYRAEIATTEEIISSEKNQVQVAEAQVESGTVPYSEALSIRAQLAATEASLAALKQGLSQTEHLLAALGGRLSAEYAPSALDLAELSLPNPLPVTVPSELVRRRPDILASEALMHSASANIGVATAAMFPSLTLSASYGQNSNATSKLFNSAGNFWDIGAGLAAPLFQGGTLWFQRRAAIEAYQASVSDYQQVVISAFQQVANVLRALEHDAEALRAQSEALASSEEARKLIATNYAAGIVGYLPVLIADAQYRQATLGYIQAKTLRLQDTAALFVALGGASWSSETNKTGT
jgi:NodT family efflux transporter outer membrane factor (OMF) lipoprotein